MRKEVYLTIDDCPSKDFRKKVDYLKRKKISAILFCIGKSMEKNEKDMVYAIKKGFVIGNHSYSHPFFNLISLKRAYEEIERTDEIIERLYGKAGIKRRQKIFRFPYGNKGGSMSMWIIFWTRLRSFFRRGFYFGMRKEHKIQNFLRTLGYKQPTFKGINYSYFAKLGLDKDADVFWTYDFQEYRIKDLKEIIKRIDFNHPSQGGSLVNKESRDIVLIHDHDNTTETFFKIIDEMIKRKFKFLRI